MDAPAGFRALVSGLHQDAMILAEGDFDKLVVNCLRHVPTELRPNLQAYLQALLNRKTPAELKGVLNRATSDIRFRSANQARDFFVAALEHLGSKRNGP